MKNEEREHIRKAILAATFLGFLTTLFITIYLGIFIGCLIVGFPLIIILYIPMTIYLIKLLKKHEKKIEDFADKLME